MDNDSTFPHKILDPAGRKCRTCLNMHFLLGCSEFTCKLTGKTKYKMSPHTVVCGSWEENRISK